MTSIVRGLVNRRFKRRPAQPTTPSPSYRPEHPQFVVLKVYGDIPQRHRFDGWQVVLDLVEDGWIAHRHKNELWLFSMPMPFDLPDMGEDDHAH